uniref:Uncharacterized protein n=1 Tax=Anguilla anguilla TaxID=7936 RepID=A0A0E9P5Z9_ANGAN
MCMIYGLFLDPTRHLSQNFTTKKRNQK